MTLTTQDLKNRKPYILAKITKVAGEENLQSYMKVMLMEVEFGFEGTVYDLFLTVHAQLRAKSSKTTKVAEARARVAEVTGVEQKSWAETKFGGY
jgi:hypothetical protein